MAKEYYRKRNKLDWRRSIITERFMSMMLKVCANPSFNKREYLSSLKSFVDQVPLNSYEKDPEIYALLLAVKSVLKNKLDGETSLEALADFVNIDVTDNFDEAKDSIIIPIILSSDDATEKETNLVMKTTNFYTRYEGVLKNKDHLSDIISDLGSGNVANIEDSLNDLETVTEELKDLFDKTKRNDESIQVVHSHDIPHLREVMQNVYNEMHSKEIVLKLGLKELNQMISPLGGIRGGTANYWYADTGSWKSAFLTKITDWIVKYNSDQFMEQFLKDGKRPCVLVVSLENGQLEDFSRYFINRTGIDIMEPKDFDEAMSLWDSKVDSIIDVCHVNASDTEEPINLEFVDRFVKKLNADEYRVIAVIVDSFDLMAPSREDIARHITDETQILSNRAKAIQRWVNNKPFPFITVHQLNRQGNQYIMEKKDNGMIDLAKSLGRSFISGAYDIERRAYFSGFIYIERSNFDGELYIEWFRSKSRGKRNEGCDYLCTKLHDGFIIHDDYGTPECNTRHSIVPEELQGIAGVNQGGQRGSSSISRRKEPTIIKVEENKNKDSPAKSEIKEMAASKPVKMKG